MHASASSTEVLVSRCVSARELSRSTASLVAEVERDGKVIAVGRYGRLSALIVPLPERLILEFEDGARPAPTGESMRRAEEEVDLEALDLSPLAREFLVDAASTPTGNWHPPDSAFLADRKMFFRTLADLDLKGLMEGAGVKRLTRQGRAVVRALRARGQMGYAEARGDIIRGEPGREGT